MYPDLIFPLYEEENQYSKGMAGKMSLFNYKRAKGTYIAYCEGDDYWTEPLKIQRQVDFLEANPDYSVCFHRCKHYNLSTDEYLDDDCGFLFQNNERGVDVSIDLFFKHWVTQPLSMVCRVNMHDINLAYKYKHYRDMHEIYHLLKEGKGYVFDFVGGVYCKHTNGISSLISKKEQYTISYMLSKELYNYSRDSYTKLFFCDTLQWLINVKARIDFKNKFYFVFELFWVGGSFRRLLKNIFV